MRLTDVVIILTGLVAIILIVLIIFMSEQPNQDRTSGKDVCERNNGKFLDQPSVFIDKCNIIDGDRVTVYDMIIVDGEWKLKF